jgi:selT/selW/selH-like putative selenoprotein
VKPLIDVSIHYCVPCGYLGLAAEMARDFYEAGGDQVALVLLPGLRGILRIEIAGEVAYDKLAEDVFPTPPRISRAVAIMRAKLEALNAAAGEMDAAAERSAPPVAARVASG